MKEEEQHGMGYIRDEPEFKRGMGYIRDKPHKDARMLCSLRECEALPTSYMIPDVTPVEDQGDLGSCTANALDNVYKIRSMVVMGNYFNGSRIASYYYEREHDGTLLDGDVGSTLSSAAWVLQTIGLADESLCPYDEAQYNNPPPAAYKAAAIAEHVDVAQRLDAQDELTTISNIKMALVKDYPVMFGFNCTSQIFKVGKDGNLPMPSGRFVGGHATCILGYDDNHENLDSSTGAVFVKNSWGTKWGAPYMGNPGGYFWMPYRYFTNTNDDVGDAWAIIQESDFPRGPKTSVTISSSPTAITRDNKSYDMFVLGSDNACWWRHHDGKLWHPWQSLGGNCTSAPAVVSVSSGTMDLFVRGADGALDRKTYEGGLHSWKEWRGAGGKIKAGTSPAAVVVGTNKIAVIVLSDDGGLWQNTFSGSTQTGWINLGKVL